MSQSTKASPFEINSGFSPQTQWSGIVSDNKGIHPDRELVVKDWEGTWQEIWETIKQAQEKQRKWHDQKRQPAPEYVTLEDISQGRAKKVDRVMLHRKNLHTKSPMEKLDHNIFGPFVVKRKVGSRAYDVEVPERWDIYPGFHVSLLEPYREDPEGRAPKCNDPMIGSYNHYHLSPNGIPSGIQRWYGLVYIIHMAGNPRIRPRE